MSLKDTIRLDVVEGNLTAPTAIYDYKFGASGLTASRIAEILQVGGFPSNTPVFEIRP
jgi:hypothetical protein